MDAMKDGMKMILGEFSRALSDLGVERVEAVGKKFDPNLHDAISHEPSESVAEGNVIKQWSCGYKMGDKLLRPASYRSSAVAGAAGAETLPCRSTTDRPVSAFTKIISRCSDYVEGLL